MTDETLARMLAHRRASVSLLSRHHPIPRALLAEHEDRWHISRPISPSGDHPDMRERQ